MNGIHAARAVSLGCLAVSAFSAPIELGGDAVRWRILPQNGQIEATVGDRSLRFLVPVPVDSEQPDPEDTLPPLRCVWSRRSDDSGAEARFAEPRPFTVRFVVDGDSLLVTVTAVAGGLDRVVPARLLTTGDWRRVDVSQFGLAHGQPQYQKAVWAEGLWTWGFWELDEGQCAAWAFPRPENAGTGPVELGPRAVYPGAVTDVRERQRIRVGTDLWSTVPPVSNPVSPYRDELGRSVFVDYWATLPASEILHRTRFIRELVPGTMSLLTVIQDWQAGGFDSLLPDSVWLPDYPPNPAVGTVDELAALGEALGELGRVAFRTNYALFRDHAPSAVSGVARRAVDTDGVPKWHTALRDMPVVALRQEPVIRDRFRTGSAFTDQLTSGGPPSSYTDHEHPSMASVARAQRALAALLHTLNPGPLGSETLNAEYLIGAWVDYGDFGVMDGHHRLLSPEYKLRRIQPLSVFFGMGLCYRFCELPPFERRHAGESLWTEPPALDDYRCTQILFGNAAYLYMPRVPFRQLVTECLLVAPLQRWYTTAAVSRVLYEYRTGDWVSLDELVAERGVVPHTRPWGEQTRAFGRVRVEYDTGLTVVVNRLPESMVVAIGDGRSLILPRAGWAAWAPGVLAFSAVPEDGAGRVDWIQDDERGYRFVDPRGREFAGARSPTAWQRDANGDWTPYLRIDLKAEEAEKGGRILRYAPPAPAPLTGIAHGFQGAVHGWTPVAGVLRSEMLEQCWRLSLCTESPQILSPPLAVKGAEVPRIRVRLRVNSGASPGATGPLQVYYTTHEHAAFSSRRLLQAPVTANGEWSDVVLDTARSPDWRESVVTRLRLDPIRTVPGCVVDLAGVWLESEP